MHIYIYENIHMFTYNICVCNISFCMFICSIKTILYNLVGRNIILTNTFIMKLRSLNYFYDNSLNKKIFNIT